MYFSIFAFIGFINLSFFEFFSSPYIRISVCRSSPSGDERKSLGFWEQNLPCVPAALRMKFSRSFTSVFFVAVIAIFIMAVPGAQGLARLAGWRSHPCASGAGMICYDDGYEKCLRMSAIENVRSNAATHTAKLFAKPVVFALALGP
jgi:hypothetical protein